MRRRRVTPALARPRRSKGGVLVEFGLVFPVFIMILMSGIDVGLVLVDLSTTRQGLREGARQAVVAKFGSDVGCTTTVPSGNTLGTTTKQLMCLSKDRIGLNETDTRVKVAFPGTNQAGNSVVVCAMYPMKSTTGMLKPVFNNRVLKAEVQMRIEKADSGLTAANETALTNADWTWCA